MSNSDSELREAIVARLSVLGLNIKNAKLNSLEDIMLPCIVVSTGKRDYSKININTYSVKINLSVVLVTKADDDIMLADEHENTLSDIINLLLGYSYLTSTFESVDATINNYDASDNSENLLMLSELEFILSYKEIFENDVILSNSNNKLTEIIVDNEPFGLVVTYDD